MAEIDLNDLAERVEKLDGPSRAVDAEIAWLTRWRWDGWDEEDVRIEDRSLEYVIERVENGFNSIWRNIPRYTESIDAALALVPEGVDWMIDNFDGVVGRRCSASVPPRSYAALRVRMNSAS